MPLLISKGATAVADILAIAKSQEGVSEHGGVSKYGTWLDAQFGLRLYYNLDWCGAFQLWLIAQGGPDWIAAAGGLHREYAEVQVWFDWMRKNGRISSTPKARRLVWYDWAGTPKGANHIGLVDHYDSSHIWAWEGNHNNQVELVRRPRDSQIMGYGEWWSHIQQPNPVAAGDASWFLGG